MKRVLLLFFLQSFSLGWSQKILFNSDMQVYYEIAFKPDSTKEKIVNNMVCLYLKKNNESLFQDERKYKIDSIIQKEKLTMLPSLPMYNVNHVIHKDLQKQQLIYSEVIDNANFGYNETINDFKWKLLDGKKTILNFQCNEAKLNFHGRDYTAWYTTSIPISDGPYKFSGLPGLILEIYDDNNNFHYMAMGIDKKLMNIVYNPTFIVIDRKKLRDSKINNIIKHKPNIKLNPMEKD